MFLDKKSWKNNAKSSHKKWFVGIKKVLIESYRIPEVVKENIAVFLFSRTKMGNSDAKNIGTLHLVRPLPLGV